jgi:anti-sigma factor RsiW
MIGAHVPYYTAPAGLEDKIRRKLRGETASPAYWQWGAIAAAVLLAVSAAGNVVLLRSQDATADAVVSAHVRSLMGTHLLDVPSSDQHTVKPWFNGKLDFAPPVNTVEGFPLLGGRAEYFEGQAAAALIYGRNKHVINLFLWPSLRPGGQKKLTRNGYHVQHWEASGMTFWAVSDLNEAELSQFVALYRSQQ